MNKHLTALGEMDKKAWFGLGGKRDVKNYGVTADGRETQLSHQDLTKYWNVKRDGENDQVYLAESKSGERTYAYLAQENDTNTEPRAYITTRDVEPGLTEIVALKTRKDQRRKGYAKSLISVAQLLEDDGERTIVVRPDPMSDKSVSAADIQKLYAKMKFVPLKDLGLASDYMVFYPEKKLQALASRVRSEGAA